MITTLLRPTLGRLTLRGARGNSSLPAGTSREPSHAHLYYHLQPPAAPRRIALSFLPRPPAAEDSRTVLGYLPAVAGVGLGNFVENKAFLALLHDSLKTAITDGAAQSVEYLAKTRPGDGYLTLTDERNVPPMGRVGEPEDVLASVFVQGGEARGETYEPAPSYRLVSNNGVLSLPADLDAYFLDVLRGVDAEERRTGELEDPPEGTNEDFMAGMRQGLRRGVAEMVEAEKAKATSKEERERLEHLGSLLGGSGSDAAFDEFLAEAQRQEAEKKAGKKD